MFKIFITEGAKQDMCEIFLHIAKESFDIANKVGEDIIHAVDQLELFPNSGLLPKNEELVKKGYRMLAVHNYLIFYVVLDDAIEVRYVMHGGRDYGVLIK